MKLAVLGAAGGIGQPLSLLLKQSTQTAALIEELALYDVAPTRGVAADLSHIDTPARVVGYTRGELEGALTGADIVIISAGLARRPGMSRDDLFAINSKIVFELAHACGAHCPDAFVALITNPVNALVPVAREALKAAGAYDARKLLGVTSLDQVRAATFLAEAIGSAPHLTEVPVVGGHSATTIVPLFSQAHFTEEGQAAEHLAMDRLSAMEDAAAVEDALVRRVQLAGDEVVSAKDGAGSATLSMAAAAYGMAEKLVQARSGRELCIYAFTESPFAEKIGGEAGWTGSCPFFAGKTRVDAAGATPVSFGLGAADRERIAAMLPTLAASAEKGMQRGSELADELAAAPAAPAPPAES